MRHCGYPGGDAAPRRFQPAVPDRRARGPGEVKPRPPQGYGAGCRIPPPAAQPGTGWGTAVPRGDGSRGARPWQCRGARGSERRRFGRFPLSSVAPWFGCCCRWFGGLWLVISLQGWWSADPSPQSDVLPRRAKWGPERDPHSPTAWVSIMVATGGCLLREPNARHVAPSLPLAATKATKKGKKEETARKLAAMPMPPLAPQSCPCRTSSLISIRYSIPAQHPVHHPHPQTASPSSLLDTIPSSIPHSLPHVHRPAQPPRNLDPTWWGSGKGTSCCSEGGDALRPCPWGRLAAYISTKRMCIVTLPSHSAFWNNLSASFPACRRLLWMPALQVSYFFFFFPPRDALRYADSSQCQLKCASGSSTSPVTFSNASGRVTAPTVRFQRVDGISGTTEHLLFPIKMCKIIKLKLICRLEILVPSNRIVYNPSLLLTCWYPQIATIKLLPSFKIFVIFWS